MAGATPTKHSFRDDICHLISYNGFSVMVLFPWGRVLFSSHVTEVGARTPPLGQTLAG